MSLIVLDASVFVAWIAPTQATPAASRLLAERKQHRFIVPDVFPVEVRNALLSAERRDKWRIAETESALELLGQLGIVVYPPLHGIDLDEAFRLARAERLSMYDGLYLMLTIENYATLASRDAALLAAAQRRGRDTYDARPEGSA